MEKWASDLTGAHILLSEIDRRYRGFIVIDRQEYILDRLMNELKLI